MSQQGPTGTPEAIVDEAYRLIGFGPGEEPQWDAFRALFDPRAVLALRVFPGDPQITVMNLDEYVVHQIREGMKEQGYAEIPGETEWFRFGDIAEARVHFGMQYGKAEPVPALDIYQLAWREGRWWIVSIVSDLPGHGGAPG
jgi:hypothetical protein